MVHLQNINCVSVLLLELREVKNVRERFKQFRMLLLDEEKSKRIFAFSVYSVLCVVSLTMTVMNIVTGKGALTFATGIFAVLCAINLLLTACGGRVVAVVQFLFSIEILVLFTFFLISGNPEGFSAIWICMLPSLGMLFFGRLRGSSLCAVMFAILVYLLWTPTGNALLLYEYTASFKMRFPVLFLAFHLLALFLETLRVMTLKEMTRLQTLYRELSIRDTLTGVLNRQGIYSELENNTEYQKTENIGVVIFDIDFFKTVNDTYGHNAGDFVLKGFASLIEEYLDAKICRWGGEEFIAVYTENKVRREHLEALKNAVENRIFAFEDHNIRITASMGVYETRYHGVGEIDLMVECADRALYEAKEAGRNRIVYCAEKHSADIFKENV